jgi:hypothetical protein
MWNRECGGDPTHVQTDRGNAGNRVCAVRPDILRGSRENEKKKRKALRTFLKHVPFGRRDGMGWVYSCTCVGHRRAKRKQLSPRHRFWRFASRKRFCFPSDADVLRPILCSGRPTTGVPATGDCETWFDTRNRKHALAVRNDRERRAIRSVRALVAHRVEYIQYKQFGLRNQLFVGLPVSYGNGIVINGHAVRNNWIRNVFANLFIGRQCENGGRCTYTYYLL